MHTVLYCNRSLRTTNNKQLLTAACLLTTMASRLATTGCLLATTRSRLATTGCPLATTRSRLATTGCLLATTRSLLATAGSLFSSERVALYKYEEVIYILFYGLFNSPAQPADTSIEKVVPSKEKTRSSFTSGLIISLQDHNNLFVSHMYRWYYLNIWSMSLESYKSSHVLLRDDISMIIKH